MTNRNHKKAKYSKKKLKKNITLNIYKYFTHLSAEKTLQTYLPGILY